MAVYKRGEIWWVRFRHAGAEIRQSAHTRKRAVAEDYERRLKEEAGRLARGGKPRHTFDELMARFMEEHFPLLSPSSQRRYNASIEMMEPVFSGKHLDEIDGPMIQRFIARRKRDGVLVPQPGGGHVRRDISPATVRRHLRHPHSATVRIPSASHHHGVAMRARRGKCRERSGRSMPCRLAPKREERPEPKPGARR